MINLSALAFRISKQSRSPYFVQLSDQIRSFIASGRIQQDSRLPPTRSLAMELGLSRSTVVTAYDQLAAEGYIEGRRGSGFYVCRLSESDYRDATEAASLPQPKAEKIRVERPASHPGNPDNRLFPYRAWGRCLARTARLTPQALIASESRFGDTALRHSIASYLSDWRGLTVDPEQILICAGSIDALETCIRTLVKRGDSIGLENPGYQPLRNIVENQGLEINWMEVSDQGTQIPQSLNPRMVVLTPSHQFPLGGTMPPKRRLEFQQWANMADAWIIEDDYDSEFRYAGRPIPAMASMDTSARTLYVGTFSKVFSVSLRLGYLVMPRNLMENFSDSIARFGIKAALPCQRALANFIDSGDFYRHIRRVRRIYAERRRRLIEQLTLQLAGYIRFEDHQAGMQISVELAAALDDQQITRLAKQQGLDVSPLSAHYGGGNAKQGLVLGFCAYTESEICSNVAILKRVLQAAGSSPSA